MSEEILIVVDEDDEVVEYLPRTVCHEPPYPLHREIFVVLTDKKGRVWMQKRSMNKEQYPGYWTVTASGHVAKGQSYLEAARRELWEEVGVKVVLEEERKWLHEREGNRAMIQVFLGRYEGEFELDLGEVSEVRAFGGKELKKVQSKMTKAARECLQMLNYLEEKK